MRIGVKEKTNKIQTRKVLPYEALSKPTPLQQLKFTELDTEFQSPLSKQRNEISPSQTALELSVNHLFIYNKILLSEAVLESPSIICILIVMMKIDLSLNGKGHRHLKELIGGRYRKQVFSPCERLQINLLLITLVLSLLWRIPQRLLQEIMSLLQIRYSCQRLAYNRGKTNDY